MASTITQRIGGAVDGIPVNTAAGGIIQATNVAGTNDITASTSPSISRYYPNQIFMIRPANINSGALTVDFGPGPLPWHLPSGADYGSGDISPNIDYMLKLDAGMTEFRTIAPLG